MKLKQLEITLQRLAGFSLPQPALEQYLTPAPLAARLLHHALMRGDIGGKSVCDLGCGTGILAIGAALCGAADVIGVEVDPRAVAVAEANADLVGADVEFIAAGIDDPALHRLIGVRDTVVMNPPFGAQKVHADRPFIDFALEIAPVTWGIFNAGSLSFLRAYIQSRAVIDEMTGGRFPIRRTFSFHTKDVQEIEVEVLRIVRGDA